jgi:hypothetical protein
MREPKVTIKTLPKSRFYKWLRRGQITQPALPN